VLELALHIVDPLGVLAYRGDLRQAVASKQDHRYTDGVHDFDGWVATVQNGWRIVPASDPNAACTVAFIGDSFTFGWAVNDDETYPNRIAQQLQDVRVLNRGVDGYNIEQIERTMNETPADGYVYFAVIGDQIPADAGSVGDDLPFLWRSATLTYWRWFQRDDESVTDAQQREYEARVQRMTERAPMVVGYFYMPPPVPDAIEIVYRDDMTVSAADGHYDAAGNAYVAQVLLEEVEQMVSEVC